MHAPPQSFRAELAAYRKKLIADCEGEPWLQLALKILDRWAERPDADTAWNTIKNKMAPEILTAEEFIYQVLIGAVMFQVDARRVRDGLPGMESLIVQRTRDHLRKRKHVQLALENTLLDDIINRSKRLFSREKETALQKLFQQWWCNNFKELCGQPLYDVVAVLTYVAFGDEVDSEDVRRTSRPTTRSGRRRQ